MTDFELEELKEIEKDFDEETALRVYEAGYRKVWFKYICQRCGKEFIGHDTKSLHEIRYRDTEHGLWVGRVRLCPACSLALFDCREKADDKFFWELKDTRTW